MRFALPRAARQDPSASPGTPGAPGAPAASQGRIPVRVVLLVFGDLISFLVFAGAGRQSHGETSGLAALGQIAVTALPFALGWYLVAPFVGAYRRSRTNGPRAMFMRTELSWLCAWPVTLLLRWIFSADHRLPISFAIVILLANAVLLGLWRTLFALVERKAR